MEEILKLIENQRYLEIKTYLDDINVFDIAEMFEELPIVEVIKVFRIMKKDKAADIFTNLSTSIKTKIISASTDKEINKIIDELFIDDAVDLIEEMPANVVTRILKTVPKETREEINRFLNYPHSSAGSIMTTEFVGLRGSYTVEKAFQHIREVALDKETIYTSYVMEKDRTLVGVIEAKQLLLASPYTLISDIMTKNFIFSKTNEDQEELARIFKKYNLLAIPIVDNENRLVGIVTIDDIVDVIQEENTEDFHKMAAMTPLEKKYLDTSVITLAKGRIIWLLVLMLSAMITGLIISGFESSLIILPILASFFPMIMGTGGNAGSQVSTLVIRSMSLKEINPKDIMRILWKESRVGIIVGFILSLITYIRIVAFEGNELALAVSISLFLTIFIAKMIGGCLPIFAKIVKIDPALMAAPLITTIVDISSLSIFFLIAKLILPTI